MVVDIHLPPASEDDEDESEVEKAPMPVQSVAQPQQPQRPFKHEVNRFQRCYSDGSQASPKRKGKVKSFEFRPNFSTNKAVLDLLKEKFREINLFRFCNYFVKQLSWDLMNSKYFEFT